MLHKLSLCVTDGLVGVEEGGTGEGESKGESVIMVNRRREGWTGTG